VLGPVFEGCRAASGAQERSNPRTLRQGRLEVSGQFEYAFGIGEQFGAFIATFRETFLVHRVVHEDRRVFEEMIRAGLPIAVPGVR